MSELNNEQAARVINALAAGGDEFAEPHIGSDSIETSEREAQEFDGSHDAVAHAAQLNQRHDMVRAAGQVLQAVCHNASFDAGWWHDLKTGHDMRIDMLERSRFGKALAAEKLCLIHSEISEAMEGHRKNLKDDKLPHRSMLEVELADAVIRIADLAGAMGLDLGGAIAEKLAFNAVRPDHKPEARAAEGGKTY